LLFFDLATQTGLRTKELLKLKAKDLSGLKAGDPLSITMGKENTVRQISISEEVARTFHEYLNKANLQPDDYLFRSRKVKKPLTISSVSHMVRSWFEATGFIVSQKKKGTIVRGLSEDDLKEITTIRLALETLVARLACSVSTVETLNHLKALMKKYVSTNNGDEFLKINRQFHYAIYRDANMPMLQQLIVQLSDRISPYCHLYILTAGDLDAQRKPSIKYHQGMLDGMLTKDPNEVVKWLKLDLNRSFTRILKVLKH
jgi:DNA-binding GntR family transcriptional regulator